MKNIAKRYRFESLLISLDFHLVVLMLLSALTLKESDNFKELVVDWVTEPRAIKEDFARAGSPMGTNTKIAEQNLRSSTTPGRESPPVEEIHSPPTTRKSIEPPSLHPLTENYTAPSSGVSSDYLSGLSDRLTSSRSGRSGYDFSDSDGDIAVLKVVLPNPKITDYGEVKLQFKINQNGTVQKESILPVSFDDPVYLNESIKALQQWRFSVMRYVSNKIYRITFRFNPE